MMFEACSIGHKMLVTNWIGHVTFAVYANAGWAKGHKRSRLVTGWSQRVCDLCNPHE